jgi:hypothetical protein
MSKNAKRLNKTTTINKIQDDDDDDVMDLEPDFQDENDVREEAIRTADYNNQKINSTTLCELHNFFQNPKFINASGDPTTNIVNLLGGKGSCCYNIPEIKIPTMFNLINKCRLDGVNMMLSEFQRDYSGIMLDFDIFQDCAESQITDSLLSLLVVEVLDLIRKIVKLPEGKTQHYAAIIRRSRVSYKEEKECYKDGFHLLIPSIKIQRPVKRFIIQELIRKEIIDSTFADIEPSTKVQIKGQPYSRKDFLDINSAHVQVFFLGSLSKLTAVPYVLTNIFESSIDSNISKKFTAISKNEHIRDKTINWPHELSLNWQVNHGLIHKNNYSVQDQLVSKLAEHDAKQPQEEAVANFGRLSTNSKHDAAITEIKDLLDTLSAERFTKYNMWFDVLCVLSNISPSYKDLAEYFSRKWSNFNIVDFEKTWNSILRSCKKRSLTLGSLHYWAKLDNPERYKQLRNNNIYTVLYTTVYTPHKRGILGHVDIAKIVYHLLQHKYVSDIPIGEKKPVWYEFILDEDDFIEGEIYKWRKCETQEPASLSNYISDVLPVLFNDVFISIKKKVTDGDPQYTKYYKEVLKNFSNSMNKLSDCSFIRNVITMCSCRFSKRGFAESLDTDPLARGVSNGVLKLAITPSSKPLLIQGYHSYPISKFTKTAYEPFNPRDPLTKLIIISLRNMFPNEEADTFEFVMMLLASTLDGNMKESLFAIVLGQGSNGKSFLMELHKAAIGDKYGAKLPINFLTEKARSSDSASPTIMMLKDASLATYSEAEQHEVLNTSRVKEVTGMETLAGRKLHQDMINFKPRCHHICTTNWEFTIISDDYGIWRRIQLIRLKITFANKHTKIPFDSNNKFHRLLNPALNKEWPEDPAITSRYLGFMVWCHYWLYRKYNGQVLQVPHPHVIFETEKYQARQNILTEFLAQRLVNCSDPLEEHLLIDEIQKYVAWYAKNHSGTLSVKGLTEKFQNSIVNKHIKLTTRGLYLIGVRFLADGAKIEDGEEYYMKNIQSMEAPDDNFGIKSETPEEYYDRVCTEYDLHKDIFDNKPTYDVNPELINCGLRNELAGVDEVKESIDNTDECLVLPSGVVLRALPDPKGKSATTMSEQDLIDMLDGIPKGEDV